MYYDIIDEKVIDVLKVLILRHIYGYNFCESYSLYLLRVSDSCEFMVPSAGHDSRICVVTKLVLEPRFCMVGPRLLEFEFSWKLLQQLDLIMSLKGFPCL